jgi:putative hydrolase of the HAD superfamily
MVERMDSASSLPKAILLDLDDTIIDDSGCVDECWADACAEAERLVAGVKAGPLQQTIASYASWWWADPERNRVGRLDLRMATGRIVAESFHQLGCGDAQTAQAIANRYRDLREERARLHDGALQTIAWLQSNGVRLGLMTNGAGAAQRAKIARFGLAPYFGHIVVEGEFGAGKPDRRVFQSLLSALQVDPTDTWAVGDNLEADVFGAMDLGIFGIWVDGRGRGLPDGLSRQPGRVITALTELRPGAKQL